MKLELDLQPAVDWFQANLPWSMVAVAAAWYWVAGQAVRVAYRRRPRWFWCRSCPGLYETCPHAEGRAFNLFVFSLILPAVVVAWIALWAVTLAAVPSPWSWWRSK
jgi:hypothetical protein